MTRNPAEGIVGRSAELAVVRELVADAAAGRGRCLLIEGEPGIGKSALLLEALAGAEAALCEVLRGQCDELGQRFPLSVMTRLLGVDERSPDPRRAATARALERESTADGWTMRLVSGDPVSAAVEQMLALVDRLCAQGPLVLVVEDLHWADEASLTMWGRLSQASAQLPLLVVGTCRPVPKRAELEELRNDVRARDGMLLPLGPLAEEAISALATLLAGGLPGPRLAERLGSAAGNPLYVRELLDASFRAGVLRPVDGVAELVAGDATAEALGSLAVVIADRLDFLSPGARDVLRTAALLGPEFSVADLGAVIEQGLEELSERVAEALTAGVLESAGARLRFRHGLLKEILYETTPTALRVALHQHAAQALIASGAPAERIAELILPALEAAGGWELDWLAGNAPRLVDRAPEIAAELLEHGLRHTDWQDPRYAAFESQLAAVCFWLGRFERAEQLARDMLRRTDDPDGVGQGHWLLGRMAMRLGRREELARLADAAPDPQVGPAWHARLLALRAEVLCFLGHDAEAAGHAAQALAEGEQLADPIAMAHALNCRSLIRLRGDDISGGLAEIDQALAVIGTDARLLDLRLSLLGNRSASLSNTGRHGEAVEAITLARTLAERNAVPRLPILLVQAGELYLEHGQWDDALSALEQATGLKEHYLFLRHGMMALILARQNAWQQADQHLAALDGRTYPPGWLSGSTYWMLARAFAAEKAGRPEEVVAVLGPLLSAEYADAIATRSDYLPLLVRAALAADDRHTALAAVQAAQRDADAEPLPRKRAYAEWCQGLLRADLSLILVGADYLRESDRRPDLGNALEDAAAVRANAGDLEGARGTLGEAVAVYEELGAAWDSRRAIARLRSCGVRLGVRGPRDRPKTGWGALTATELKVAEQVAQGRANPDIAAQLMLSRRTIETHVSHILAKLQVRSRRELAESRA